MKVISFIEQPLVIRRILEHLDLWGNPRSPPELLEMVCEPDADYIPWQDDVLEIEVGLELSNRASWVRFVPMWGFRRDQRVYSLTAEEFG